MSSSKTPNSLIDATFFERFRDQGLRSEGGSTTFEWVKSTAVKLYPKKGEAAGLTPGLPQPR